MAGTGQTLNDRLNAARYALAGQGLARVVCKATTEEVIGPKKKHLDYLLQCTHEPNVSIPQLANLLIERTNHSSWVVVFKALVTVHHLMCYGNERFTQYLASSNCNFQLSNFLDKTGVKGYEMSTFIRRYAKYLNEKALSYRTVAFDFTKIKRGKEDGSLRSMNTEKLLKTIPSLQSQVDSLLEFDCNANDLTNGVINAAFMLLFRDLIRLFACYNDGIINCLEKYFDMNKKHARDALDIYKKFLIRMDRVAEFLKVAENVGIDKGEIPDLTKAPSSLLDALEQHLAQLEGKKGQTTNKGKDTNGSTSNGSIVAEAINGASKEDPALKKALEEEEQMLNKLKERHINEQSMKPNNPFLSMSPTTEKGPQPSQSSASSSDGHGILDLFSDNGNAVGMTGVNAVNMNTNNSMNQSGTKASDDLLSLSNANPFADILNAANMSAPTPVTAFGAVQMSGLQQHGMGMGMGMSKPMFNNGTIATVSSNNAFASDAGFAAAFGSEITNTSASSGFDNVNERYDESEHNVDEAVSTSDQPLDTLPVPGGEDPMNRSTSPSPTHDIMRGAGTTPILSNAPETFGDDSGGDEASLSRGNSPSPAKKITAPPPSGENSPFGPPFEPPHFAAAFSASFGGHIKIPAPARPPPPGQEMGPESGHAPPARPPPPSSGGTSPVPDSDFFSDESNFGESAQPSSGSAPPPRPPMPSAAGNVPFAAFDAFDAATQQQIIMQQQLAYQQMLVAQQQAALQQQQQKPTKKSAFADLDMAMRETMTKPQQPIGQTQQQQQQATVAQQQQGMVVLPQGFVLIPGSYGSGFDAFGDVLQPQLLASKGQSAVSPPTAAPTSTTANQGLFKGDLDSSLASLAQNLDINGPKSGFKKPGQQWSSPKNTVKTGAPTQSAAAAGGWTAAQPMAWNATGAQMPGVPGQAWTGTGGQPMMVPGNMPMMPQGYAMQMRPGMVPGSMIPPGAVQVLPSNVTPMMANNGTARPQMVNTSDPFGAL